ncbi:MAG: NAD(P)/FAD-dependent oxidoreductase [Flavisolibacter sp.]
MQEQQKYNVAVIGGGLAGLSVAISLANTGRAVVLLEKNAYPFHKVCGEYLSMESWNFLVSLGLPLPEMRLPLINTLRLSAPNGKFIERPLPLGGFGIRRFTLDHALAELAKQKGVRVLTNTRVEAVENDGREFTLHIRSTETSLKEIHAQYCCGSFGKRSKLGKAMNDTEHRSRKENYVAVKYHVLANERKDLIQLHNFRGGYCGFSAVDENKFCLCYLVKAECLRANANNILKMQENVLYKNPELRRLFHSVEILPGFPLTISQISFERKPAVREQMLMLGDAAGMVAPLAGNGMSMALHSGKIAARLIDRYLSSELSLQRMQHEYERAWQHTFSTRFRVSRGLQQFFGHERMTNYFVSMFRVFPSLASPVIRLTHGQPF